MGGFRSGLKGWLLGFSSAVGLIVEGMGLGCIEVEGGIGRWLGWGIGVGIDSGTDSDLGTAHAAAPPQPTYHPPQSRTPSQFPSAVVAPAAADSSTKVDFSPFSHAAHRH